MYCVTVILFCLFFHLGSAELAHREFYSPYVCDLVSHTDNNRLSSADLFNDAGNYYNIDPDLLRAIAIVESQCGKRLDHKGTDVGIMAITHYWYDQPSEIIGNKTNIYKAAQILNLYKQQLGSIEKAVRAYNVGPSHATQGNGYKYLSKVLIAQDKITRGELTCRISK